MKQKKTRSRRMNCAISIGNRPHGFVQGSFTWCGKSKKWQMYGHKPPLTTPPVATAAKTLAAPTKLPKPQLTALPPARLSLAGKASVTIAVGSTLTNTTRSTLPSDGDVSAV